MGKIKLEFDMTKVLLNSPRRIWKLEDYGHKIVVYDPSKTNALRKYFDYLLDNRFLTKEEE